MFGFSLPAAGLLALSCWHCLAGPSGFDPSLALAKEFSVRSILRIATVAAGAALCGLGLAPAAQSANVVQLTVSDSSSYEGVPSCPSGAGTCTVRSGNIQFMIQIAWGSWRPKNTPINVGYQ